MNTDDTITVLSAYRGALCDYDVKSHYNAIIPRSGRTKLDGELITAMEKKQCYHIQLFLRPLFSITEDELRELSALFGSDSINKIEVSLNQKWIGVYFGVVANSDSPILCSFSLSRNENLAIKTINRLRSMGFCLDPELIEKGLVTFTKP